MVEPTRDWERVRRWVARHERSVARAYLAAVLLGLVLIAFPPSRQVLLGGIQTVLDRWERRWTYRVERGVELASTAPPEEAARHLADLDEEFPAIDVRHARDKERERLLRALGWANERADRKGSALDAYRRAVLFDPLNYANREALARAALHFEEEDEAREQLLEILRLNPGHLPSLSALVALRLEDGDWAGVADTYRAYLDAYVVRHLVIEAGETRVSVPVPADGRPHELRIPLDSAMVEAVATHGELALGPGASGLEVRSISLEPPLPPGAPPLPSVGTERPATAGEGWTMPALAADTTFGSPLEPVREPADDPYPGRRVRVPLPPAPYAPAAIRLEVRLTKPVDRSTWQAVETALRNQLEFEALQALRARSFVRPRSSR